MRSEEEIIQRLKDIEEEDFFGYQSEDLISCLPFESAKPYLTEGATEKDWEVTPRDREAVITRMLNYMPFAWKKANECRGLSAGRSMDHYKSWVWLAGDDLGNFRGYEFYGKDILVKICKFYGWDPSQWDDGIRVNSEEELYSAQQN